MSCNTATFPININSTYNKNTCSLKCNFSFDYNNSSTTISKEGDYLKLTYDTPPTNVKAQVTFSNKSYIVSEIRIYKKSLHTYGDESPKHAPAEMLIYHDSITSNKPLVVCIPIIISNDVTYSSKTLNDIITLVASSSKNSDPVRLNNGSLNLNNFIPNKSYYSYIGSAANEACAVKKNYLVYDITNAINFSQDIYDKLNIDKSKVTIQENDDVFYNGKGSKNIMDSDDIYIKCHPTNATGDKINTEPQNAYENKPSELYTLFKTYFPTIDTTNKSGKDAKPKFMDDLLYYGGTILSMIVILFIFWKLAVLIKGGVSKYRNKGNTATPPTAPTAPTAPPTT
jgi:carbonic anhydrase